MTGVLIRKWDKDTQGRESCEDEGRGQRDAANSQGTPRVAGSTPRAAGTTSSWKRQGWVLPGTSGVGVALQTP